MKRFVIQLMLILSFTTTHTFYGMSCCRAQDAIELDEETAEANQRQVDLLNNDNSTRYVIDLKTGKTTNVSKFHTRNSRSFWTLKAAAVNYAQIITIEPCPTTESYFNNDQIIGQHWKIIGHKKGDVPITFQEQKGRKIISEMTKTISVME